jgi:pimeloyl-ACP methyl ester carboxylesterase
VPQKYVRVDGVATFVQHVGPTTLPERPPLFARGETVVCLHGAGGNSGVFSDLLARLEPAHSPLAFDRPGHARSGGLDSLPSISRMSEFTRALCAAIGLDRCVLLGASMGGCIALETAIAAPALVAALVLVGTGARCEVGDTELEKLRLVTEGKARREFNRAEYSPHASPDVMRRGFMEDLKTDPRVVYGNALALRGWSREADLGRISCPTLVVVGEDDAGMRAESQRLASGISGARQVVVPKCGHRVALEQPEALAEAVLGFLSELAR